MTKVSIVMPCFNVDKTIRRALDSILMQQVDFEYEILAVDDASTDSTSLILEEYAARYGCLRLVVNMNNLGNAKSFKKASMASRGKYLCVLDGDDFWSVRDKLQKQVNFLDGDYENQYFACAHRYLTLNPDGTLQADPRLFERTGDHDYIEFITRKFYCHTSTMLYRNVFGDIDIPVLETQRGDTIRSLIVMNSGYGKVKVLDFIGSVYTINPKGIWTSLEPDCRKQVNVDTWKSCRSFVVSDREKKIIGQEIIRMENEAPPKLQAQSWQVEAILRHLHFNIANPIAFADNDFVFRKLYKSDYVDSFCESLGYISKQNFPNPDDIKKGIVIVISALNKTGGGIYQEILELVELLQSQKVTIILTDMSSLNELSEDVKKDFTPFHRLSFLFLKNFEEKLPVLQKEIIRLNPKKIYWYIGHNNVWADAALQKYGAKNIVLFSFDHGLSLGLSNTNIDLFIAKTPKDYKLLSNKFGPDRVIYIPCWSVAAKTEKRYFHLLNGKLTTATAAARFYKYQGHILGSFQYFVVNLLKATGGKHVHYGPLPDTVKSGIKRALKRAKIPDENFIHIEWAFNLPDSMLEKGVDLYIAPFPITSIKLGLQCISAGIPVLAYAGGLTRIEQTDFLGDVLMWKNKDAFFELIASLNAAKLQKLSASGLEYFKVHNSLSAVAPYVLMDKCYDPVPLPPKHLDNTIIDAAMIVSLLNLDDFLADSGK